jgi:hypothetical protein
MHFLVFFLAARRGASKSRDALLRPLDLSRSAIYGNLRTGYVTGILGGKEGNRLGNFLGLGEPTQRDLGRKSPVQSRFVILGHETIQTRCIDWTRANHVHADFAVFEIPSPAAGKRTHGGFCPFVAE